MYFIEQSSVELALIAFPVIRAPNQSVCLGSVRLQLHCSIHPPSNFSAPKTCSYSRILLLKPSIKSYYSCDACKREGGRRRCDDDGVDYAHFVSSDREPNFLLLVRMRKGKQVGKGGTDAACGMEGVLLYGYWR